MNDETIDSSAPQRASLRFRKRDMTLELKIGSETHEVFLTPRMACELARDMLTAGLEAAALNATSMGAPAARAVN